MEENVKSMAKAIPVLLLEQTIYAVEAGKIYSIYGDDTKLPYLCS